MRTWIWLALFPLALACNGSKGSDAEADTDTDTDSDSDTDTDSDADADCADPRDAYEGEEHFCEGSDSQVPQEANFATGFYVGDWTVDGDEWSGQERWVLFANPVWESNGGYDCEVVWDAFGIAQEEVTGNCALCDTEVIMQLTINSDDTTCPIGLWEGDENLTETYGVITKNDGTADFYFSESGNKFGEGEAKSGCAQYESGPFCHIF